MRKRTQPHAAVKKGLAIGLSALLGLGGAGAATYGIVKVLRDDISSGIEYNVDDLLTEEFNINNETEVRNRANAIWKISEQTVPEEDIVNLIYYVNGKYDMIKFSEGTTDQEKYDYVQKTLNMALVTILSDNKQDDIMALEESLYGKEKGYSKEEMSEVAMLAKNDKEIFGYMFLAKNNELKQRSIEFYECVYKQLEAIKNGNVEQYDKNSDEFYKLFEELLDTDIDYHNELLAKVDFRSKFNLFTLTEKQAEKIDADFMSVTANIGSAFLKANNINEDGIIKNAIANGTGNEITPDGNNYNASDAKEAEKYIASTTSKIEVDKGGSSDGTYTEVVGGNIIGTVTHSEVSTEGETIVTEFIDGGDVIETIVETSIVQIDGEEETIVVEEGGITVEEPHGEITYSDADTGSIQYTLR